MRRIKIWLNPPGRLPPNSIVVSIMVSVCVFWCVCRSWLTCICVCVFVSLNRYRHIHTHTHTFIHTHHTHMRMHMHMHMETHTFAQILRNIKFNISTYLQAGIPLSQLQAIDIKFCCFIMHIFNIWTYIRSSCNTNTWWTHSFLFNSFYPITLICRKPVRTVINPN